MRYFIFYTVLIVISFSLFRCTGKTRGMNNASTDPVERRIDSVLGLMDNTDKIGQLAQYSNPYHQTGAGEASRQNDNFDQMIRDGQIGSFLNITGAEETLRLQKIAVEESKLGIPLLFALDVIHGLKTMFPIPLAEAASWDMEMLEKSARIAAIEASATGLNWTFAPMIDVSRDARWGRVMEGAGEDVFLNCEAAKARIRGFQGNDLAADNSIAACAKHFAAYSAPLAGREYNSVDISERTLREVYLPPFKVAVDEGVATFMSGFNTLGGVPVSGSRYLQTEILRNEWGFKGFVVSDWNSVGELRQHGAAKDGYEAAYLGFNAGVDMDMEGRLYIEHIEQLIKDEKITQQQLDQAVRRILRVKFQLGLFDNPYQYSVPQREKDLLMNPEHLKASREVAKRSIVMLKNENNILPLKKEGIKIAVIGPLADDKDSPIGNWRAKAESNSAVSIVEGIKDAVSENSQVRYAKGCDLISDQKQWFFVKLEINETDRSGFDEAVKTAQQADVVVMALGETAYMSGECRSYTDLTLQGLQNELLTEIRETGKPVVTLISCGRPLVLTDVVDKTDALLINWQLGHESGNAIADVLFGDYNPSGKLPMSFPYHVGQVPVSYEERSTGRPNHPDIGNTNFASIYRDAPNEPLFAFGYGLSYTTFQYSDLLLNTKKITKNDTLKLSVSVKNIGNSEGEEVVQLYVRDVVAFNVSRPLKQLKGFEKITLKPSEKKTITFELTPQMLAYYRFDKTFAPEAGEFEIFIGSASNDIRLQDKFELK